MAEDWAANVKKYVPDADDGIIAGIVRYCGIALQKRDSSLVSFGDAAEMKRVRDNFLRKKLALSDSDDQLDAAIAAIGERMKGENFRNRVTVYYLLAESFGKLPVFAKAAKASKPSATKKPAAAAEAAVAPLASLAASDTIVKTNKALASRMGASKAKTDSEKLAGESAVSDKAAIAAAEPAKVATPVSEAAADAVGTKALGSAPQALKSSPGDGAEAGGPGLSALMWLVLIAVVLGVVWWLYYGKPAASGETRVATQQSQAAPRQV